MFLYNACTAGSACGLVHLSVDTMGFTQAENVDTIYGTHTKQLWLPHTQAYGGLYTAYIGNVLYSYITGFH